MSLLRSEVFAQRPSAPVGLGSARLSSALLTERSLTSPVTPAASALSLVFLNELLHLSRLRFIQGAYRVEMFSELLNGTRSLSAVLNGGLFIGSVRQFVLLASHGKVEYERVC